MVLAQDAGFIESDGVHVGFDAATGQNDLGTPLIVQWRGGALRTVWPFDVASVDALYPLPRWRERE
jgi:hypothetical protein